MFSELRAFDSLNSKPNAVYYVPEASLDTSVLPSGENLNHAGGVSFNIKDFGNRLFVWLSDNDKLRVSELSFTNDLSNNVVEFRFSNARILRSGIFYENSGLYILVCTTHGVYREHFMGYQQINAFESVFNSERASTFKLHPIKSLSSQEIICSATGRHGDAYSLYAYGLSGGSIIFVSLSDQNQDIRVLPVVSRNLNLWSGLIPSFSNKQPSENFEIPVSVAFLIDVAVSPVLASVCKDHYFRAWDLQHCQCISSIDLLQCLSNFSSCFNDFADTKQRVLAFSPGVNHCIKTVQNFALIYLELLPTKKFPLPPIRLTYWIWVRLNNYNNKLAFDVVCVEPLKHMPNFQDSHIAPICSLIDFAPFLSCDGSNIPNHSIDTSYSGTTLPSLCLWALVDVPSSEGSNQPLLQLSKYDLSGSRISPTSTSSVVENCFAQLCQEPLPQSIFVHERSEDEECVNLEAFMDFIFTPGRFAKLALRSAFESLKLSHHLEQQVNISDSTIPTLKREINYALISALRTSLTISEFQTLLRTFYQSIVDYHQRAFEPLGLFCVQSNGDAVVVHHSGVSVARLLQPVEKALLEASFADCKLAESAGELRAMECLLSRCHRVVKGLAQSQVWLKHERMICDNFENFQHTEATLDQLRADLLAEDLFALSDIGEDVVIEGMEEAFCRFLELLSTPGTNPSLVAELENEDDIDKSSAEHISLCKINYQRSSSLKDFGSSLYAELLRQGVWQTTNIRLRFCVAMHLLLHYCNYTSTSFKTSQMKKDLQQMYRCLAFIQWLTVTRAAPAPHESFLSSVWTHLKLLGMKDLIVQFASSGDFNCSSHYSLSNKMPLLSSGLSILEELILFATEETGLSVGAVEPSMQAHSAIITALQECFCPLLKGGEAIAPLLRHLLFSARCNELLTLCKCLAPNSFANVDLKGPFRACRKENANGGSKVNLVTECWWPGDVNALHICAFFALLWSGLTDEAIEQHIQGSLYLRNRLLSRLFLSEAEYPPELALNEGMATPCSLLEKLFPTFSDSLELSKSSQECQSLSYVSFAVDEIQIRYLIKVIPVLEQANKPENVIRLCEHALEIIQNASNNACAQGLLNLEVKSPIASRLGGIASTSADDDISHTEVHTSRSLFPTLAVSTDDVFFCKLAQNLSELEAVLRTRIFRHELAMGNAAKAHALVISNPDKARQRDCLHLLITTLCDRSEATDLVNFEYGPLENELISTLESRARATDVLPKTTSRRHALKGTHEGAVKQENVFYAVLYAYYVRRLKFHSAAEVCFEQIIRLAQESALLPPALPRRPKLDGPCGSDPQALAVLQQQAFYLSACINTLEILPVQDQWIIRPDSKITFLDNLKLKASVSDFSWAFDDEKVEMSNSCSKEDEKIGGFEDILNPNNLSFCSKGRRILRLKDLEYQYLIIRARLRLAQVSWEQGMLRMGNTSPSDLYVTLIATALYEEAFQLLIAFNFDPSLLVNAIACRCAALMDYKQALQDEYLPCLPALTNVTSALNVERALVTKSVSAFYDYFDNKSGLMVEEDRKSNLLGLYWSLLRILLTGLNSCGFAMIGDKPRAKWDLHLIACRTLLTGSLMQSSFQLPGWLMQILSRNPSGPVVPLLRLLLDHDRLQEAYRLVKTILTAANSVKPGQRLSCVKQADLQQLQQTWHSTLDCASTPTHFPHSLFIRLLEALDSAPQVSHAYCSIHTKLQGLLKSYYSVLVLRDAKHQSLSLY